MDTPNTKFSGYMNDINRVVNEALASQTDHQHGTNTQSSLGTNQPLVKSNNMRPSSNHSYWSTPQVKRGNILSDDNGLSVPRYYILDDSKSLSTSSRPLPILKNLEKAPYLFHPHKNEQTQQINYDHRPSSSSDASDLYLQRFQREKNVWRKYIKILIVALVIAILIAAILLMFVVLLVVGVIEPSSTSKITVDSTPNIELSENTSSAAASSPMTTLRSTPIDSVHQTDPILRSSGDTTPKTTSTQTITYHRIIIGNNGQVN